MEALQKRLTIDELRSKRYIAEAVFKKFTEARRFYDSYGFCFYEGEDAKYYNHRIQNVFGDKIISYPVGNKKAVLAVMNRISTDPLYNNVCVMFFVDRDYDESVMGICSDLYETPCYSIENLYAQESVFSRILIAEFGLSFADADYQKCMQVYRDRLNEFNHLMIEFNAIVKYQHRCKEDIQCNFGNIKTAQLVLVSLDEVSKANRYEEQIQRLLTMLQIGKESICDYINELKIEEKPHLVFRGKNQLDFMVDIINLLKEQNSGGAFFEEKRNGIKISISKNRLSELSQYAETPKELMLFLKEHAHKLFAS